MAGLSKSTFVACAVFQACPPSAGGSRCRKGVIMSSALWWVLGLLAVTVVMFVEGGPGWTSLPSWCW